MSSKFLTFMFIILVSVQLSSCGLWGSFMGSDKTEKLSTEKTTGESSKDDEPNSAAAIMRNDIDAPLPKADNVTSSDNNDDVSTRTISSLSKITTSKNVSTMPNEEFDEYPEEESPKSFNSEKEIKSIPPSSTSSSDPILNYVFSSTTQITEYSKPTTEKSESVSPSTDNTNTPVTPENTPNITYVNNVPRGVGEDIDNAGDTSSEGSSSTISSSLETSSFEIEAVGNSSEFITPEVTYAPKDVYVTSSVDGEKESDYEPSGRKDKETHSPRDINAETDSSTQKLTTEASEIVSSSTDGTNTPTITENVVNSTSNVIVARNVNDTAIHDPIDLDPSASIQANTTIKTILSTSTDTMNTTEMAGSMSNGTTPEVSFGSFVNSGTTGNTYSQLILNLCILIFSISVIV